MKEFGELESRGAGIQRQVPLLAKQGFHLISRSGSFPLTVGSAGGWLLLAGDEHHI